MAGQTRRSGSARMLLASLPALQPEHAEEEHRVLGGEIRPKHGARRGERPQTRGNGLARARDLGVPAEKERH